MVFNPKNNEEIYTEVKTSEQNKKKKLEKRKDKIKSKTNKQNKRLWRNCGINQGSDAKNQMTWQWPPVNTSLPNTTMRKRHEKK